METVLLADDWTELPAQMEEQLYWIAQEALNNSLKHAEASQTIVQLTTDDEMAQIQIADDGKGFDPEAVSAKGGMGLINMRERAERLGAELSITSTLGAGTIVRVTLRLGKL